MKSFLLINSGLPLEFWLEAIDITHYLQNQLPIKSQKKELVSEKA